MSSLDAPSEPVQLFRTEDCLSDDVAALLNCACLTAEDIDAFLAKGTVPEQEAENESEKEHRILLKRFDERRKQIREWAAMVDSGGAHFDPHSERLVLTRGDPQQQHQHQHQQEQEHHVAPAVADLPPPRPAVAGVIIDNAAFEQDDEEEERQWLELEEREAKEAITRAIRRYEQENVPSEEYELIEVAPRVRTIANLTFRRICFAVLAVVTAFVCIMLQTLPLLHTVPQPDPVFDKLLNELVHVRGFAEHAKECPGLHRDASKGIKVLEKIPGIKPKPNCADGVVHIPAQRLLKRFTQSQNFNLNASYTDGVNVTWFLPCHSPSTVCPQNDNDAQVCREGNVCFRGIHDGMISQIEVNESLRTAANLIDAGNDHTDIHYDVHILHKRHKDMLHKLRSLFYEMYGLTYNVEPVAFRINVAVPMDGSGVPLFHVSNSTDLLAQCFNLTTTLEGLEATKRQNELAAYNLPPPFATKVFRDPCRLLSDTEVDSRFAIHTSIFLSDGAGGDFTGGTVMYVDQHRSNSNPRRKIQRGITIDGSVGRIIVSTGGQENMRCRLPTRFGVRAVLQIWWDRV